jgi:hypothetical protein
VAQHLKGYFTILEHEKTRNRERFVLKYRNSNATTYLHARYGIELGTSSTERKRVANRPLNQLCSYPLRYIEMGWRIFSDANPVCGVQYVGTVSNFWFSSLKLGWDLVPVARNSDNTPFGNSDKLIKWPSDSGIGWRIMTSSNATSQSQQALPKPYTQVPMIESLGKGYRYLHIRH